jgi:hypothetical protein
MTSKVLIGGDQVLQAADDIHIGKEQVKESGDLFTKQTK